MTRVLVVALVLTCFVGLAGAQTLTQSITGGYGENYLVVGRIVDKDGEPAKGAQVRVTILQNGVVDRAGEPPSQRGIANCKGDFIIAFQGYRAPTSRGSVRVTVEGILGEENVTQDAPSEGFWRRTDLSIKLPYAWQYLCTDGNDPRWGIQLSVSGRLLNRTAPYDENGVHLEARAYQGPLALLWHDTVGNVFPPPHGDGRAETIYTDERGDFKYTWTFGGDVVPGGYVQVVATGGKSFNATVDPTTRLAVLHAEVSGQGPAAAETPGPSFALFALALVAAALVAGRKRRA